MNRRVTHGANYTFKYYFFLQLEDKLQVHWSEQQEDCTLSRVDWGQQDRKIRNLLRRLLSHQIKATKIPVKNIAAKNLTKSRKCAHVTSNFACQLILGLITFQVKLQQVLSYITDLLTPLTLIHQIAAWGRVQVKDWGQIVWHKGKPRWMTLGLLFFKL